MQHRELLVDLGEARFGLAGDPERGAREREHDGGEKWSSDRFHRGLYGNFRKYGTVSCSVSAIIQRLTAKNA